MIWLDSPITKDPKQKQSRIFVSSYNGIIVSIESFTSKQNELPEPEYSEDKDDNEPNNEQPQTLSEISTI